MPNILGHPSTQSKMNNFPWHLVRSLFQVKKYEKNNFLFLALSFSLSLLRTHTTSIVPLPSINPYCILSISTTMQTPIQNLPVQFESMFQQLYSTIKVLFRGSPFPLKIGTNELNTHSSGNLSLNKTLNMFIKDFKQLSPPALNNSIATQEDPFLIFIRFITHHTF